MIMFFSVPLINHLFQKNKIKKVLYRMCRALVHLMVSIITNECFHAYSETQLKISDAIAFALDFEKYK